MVDNVEVQNVKIKFNVQRGADQTVTINVKGDTMAEVIKKIEEFAQDSKDNIESLGNFKVKQVEISLGENSFFDFGAIFR